MSAASTNPGRADPTHGWLVCAGRVLASAEVAVTQRQRRNGLIGRRDLDGAFVIDRCRWIHTVGMRFPIDVAFVDSEGIIIKTASMGRFRIGTPVLRARLVIEARRGAFERWGLHVGDVLEIRPSDHLGS